MARNYTITTEHDDLRNDEQGVKTFDVNLIGALLALGFKPIKNASISVYNPRQNRHMEQVSFPRLSECGKFEASKMCEAWKNPQSFIGNNPEHPMSYIMAAFGTAIAAKRQMTEAKASPHHLIMRGRSIVLIGENANLVTQEKLLGQFRTSKT